MSYPCPMVALRMLQETHSFNEQFSMEDAKLSEEGAVSLSFTVSLPVLRKVPGPWPCKEKNKRKRESSKERERKEVREKEWKE